MKYLIVTVTAEVKKNAEPYLVTTDIKQDGKYCTVTFAFSGINEELPDVENFSDLF